MARRTVSAVPPILAAFIIAAGCGPTDPVISVDFPYFFIQDINVSGIPAECGFLKAGGEGIASADSLYFVDFQNGYVRARIDTGYPIDDVGATAEGGYALVLCGSLLFHVSDETYIVHEPTVLPSPGRFILTDPYTGNWLVYSIGAGGDITAVNTLSWDVVATYSVTGLDDPVAAAITADGTAIFVADGQDDTVARILTSDPGTISTQCQVPGGVSDLYAGGGDLVYAALDSVSAIWALDRDTGQRYTSYPLTMPAISVAVTPDDHYIYAGFNGTGITVINAQNGDIEATTTDYGTPYDIAVDESGYRALLCTSLGKIIVLGR